MHATQRRGSEKQTGGVPQRGRVRHEVAFGEFVTPVLQPRYFQRGVRDGWDYVLYYFFKDWQDHREGIVWAMEELGKMQMWYIPLVCALCS